MKIFKKQLKVDLTPKIRKLEALSRRVIREEGFGGEYKSSFKGAGIEFESYRQYINDYDDADRIDWKASNRARELLVKTYSEERGLDVFILVDVSENMVFGSGEKLKNEYAIELIASLSHAILEVGDNVGLATFSDKPIIKMLPKRSPAQFYNITRALLDPNIYGGKFDFNAAMRFLFEFIDKPNTLVIIISDFTNLPSDWTNLLGIVGVKYDVIAIMVRDIRDKTLPEDGGEVLISDSKTGKQLLIDCKIIKKKFEEYVKKQEEEIKDTFLKYRIDFVNLTTNKSFVGPVLDYFTRRGARWI